MLVCLYHMVVKDWDWVLYPGASRYPSPITNGAHYELPDPGRMTSRVRDGRTDDPERLKDKVV